MDPNKRGNPPFEPSSYAAGLERRVKRCERWSSRAREAARWLLDGTKHEKVARNGQWQDIATAPTDGTPILAYFGETAGEDRSDIAVAVFLQDTWRLCEWPEDELDDPTHWMQLPTPPSSKGTNDGR